jgi:hypothetical protein
MPKTKSKGLDIRTDDSWRVEGDLSALMEAEKIKADPNRMAAVQRLAKEKMMAVAKVAMNDSDAD